MTTPGDPISLLSRALDQTGDIIARVEPAQADLPTPCKSFTVRELINHVVLDAQGLAVAANGGRFERRDVDVIGDDWEEAYRVAADELLSAWRREGALERTLHLPFGDVPATWSVNQQTTNFTVHSWDIAKATGQSTDLDPEIGQLALDWSRENLTPEFRGEEGKSAFGPEVPVPDDAPLYDRLAGFFGRNPS